MKNDCLKVHQAEQKIKVEVLLWWVAVQGNGSMVRRSVHCDGSIVCSSSAQSYVQVLKTGRSSHDSAQATQPH
jgi:hypothetical protein